MLVRLPEKVRVANILLLVIWLLFMMEEVKQTHIITVSLLAAARIEPGEAKARWIANAEFSGHGYGGMVINHVHFFQHIHFSLQHSKFTK